MVAKLNFRMWASGFFSISGKKRYLHSQKVKLTCQKRRALKSWNGRSVYMSVVAEQSWWKKVSWCCNGDSLISTHLKLGKRAYTAPSKSYPTFSAKSWEYTEYRLTNLSYTIFWAASYDYTKWHLSIFGIVILELWQIYRNIWDLSYTRFSKYYRSNIFCANCWNYSTQDAQNIIYSSGLDVRFSHLHCVQ